MKAVPAPPAAAKDQTLKSWVAPCRVETTNKNALMNSGVWPVSTASINTRMNHRAVKGERKRSTYPKAWPW